MGSRGGAAPDRGAGKPRPYERVKPPLAEYEDNLLSGAGAAMAMETFRVMDPVSQRMIGLRADMTPQVARIATTRLKDAPRPLRLCYAGQVLRVKGGGIRSERQVGQVGAELIGSDDVAADVEVVSVAAEALGALGISGLSVDLTLPTLVPAVVPGLRRLGRPRRWRSGARRALDHQGRGAATAALGGGRASIVFGTAFAWRRKAGGGRKGAAGAGRRSICRRLPRPNRNAPGSPPMSSKGRLRRTAPDLAVTIDPVENRGFEYHTGISFAFFAARRACPASWGAAGAIGPSEGGEPATGFTLYTDTVLLAMPGAT